jgi:hypothetical protein
MREDEGGRHNRRLDDEDAHGATGMFSKINRRAWHDAKRSRTVIF